MFPRILYTLCNGTIKKIAFSLVETINDGFDLQIAKIGSDDLPRSMTFPNADCLPRIWHPLRIVTSFCCSTLCLIIRETCT